MNNIKNNSLLENTVNPLISNLQTDFATLSALVGGGLFLLQAKR